MMIHTILAILFVSISWHSMHTCINFLFLLLEIVGCELTQITRKNESNESIIVLLPSQQFSNLSFLKNKSMPAPDGVCQEFSFSRSESPVKATAERTLKSGSKKKRGE